MAGFADLTVAQSCRVIGFESARIDAGFVNGFFLTVSGTKPDLNMDVDLRPVQYIRQPEYWAWEVVGCMNGIGLPTEAPFAVTVELRGAVGTKGIEVVGAGSKKRFDITLGS